MQRRDAAIARLAAFGLVSIALTASNAMGSDYGLLLSHDLNVWSWEHSLGWDRIVADRFVVTTNAGHTLRLSRSSNVTRRSSATEAMARVEYSATPELTLGSELAFDQSHLESGSAASDVIDRRAGGLARYEFYPGVRISGGLGAAYGERRNVGDMGLAWKVGVDAQPLRQLDLADRADLNISFEHDAVASDQGDAATALTASGTLRWARTLRQTFSYNETRDAQRYVSTQAGNPIRTRINSVRKIGTSLTGLLPLLGGYQFDADYRWGDVQDDASDDPASLKFRTDNATGALTAAATWYVPLTQPSVTLGINVGRSERDADPTPFAGGTRANDLDRRRNDLGASMSSEYHVGTRDTVTVSGRLTISREHTPSVSEVNDRDDYTRSLVAIWRHRFRSGMSTQLRVERRETHHVWLESARSANSRWDRALNMWATTRASIGALTLTQRAFFKAQLEEFDFDYLTPDRPRSRNARIGRLDFAAELPWITPGTFAATYTVEARTRGTLLPAETPGQRPKIWQLTRNELAQIVGAHVTARIARRWTVSPEVTASRQREFVPTQTTWNILKLGREIETQDALSVAAECNYRPERGMLSLRAERTYRRRPTITDARTTVTLAYQHMF